MGWPVQVLGSLLLSNIAAVGAMSVMVCGAKLTPGAMPAPNQSSGTWLS